MQVVDVWKKFSHPNCVTLREVFTTKAFGDNSLILVYDHHAGSQTLLSKYFTPASNGYTSSAFSGDARPFSHKNTLQRTGKFFFKCFKCLIKKCFRFSKWSNTSRM